MTLTDVEKKMEQLEAAPFTMDAARDFAALCVIHDHMTQKQALGSRPTLAQVEQALGAVAITSEADAQRAEDLRTWAKIIGGEK